MGTPALQIISPQEYLRIERSSNDKNEYFEGQILAMGGATLAHNRIVANLVRKIGNALESKSCEILPSDIRVTAPFYESYMYPDATIVCGKPEMEDNKFDTLTNPTVIFEVLSPGTEDHDRGKKFFYYRQIPSLKEYILIDTLQPFIEISYRKPDNSWLFSEINILEDKLILESVGIEIGLTDIYQNIQFNS